MAVQSLSPSRWTTISGQGSVMHHLDVSDNHITSISATQFHHGSSHRPPLPTTTPHSTSDPSALVLTRHSELKCILHLEWSDIWGKMKHGLFLYQKYGKYRLYWLVQNCSHNIDWKCLLKKLLCDLYRQHLCNPDIIYQTIILQLLTYPSAILFFFSKITFSKGFLIMLCDDPSLDHVNLETLSKTD